MAGLTDAVAVAVGDSHTCALRETGRIVCWGLNDVGQFGFGSGVGLTPAPVAGLHDISAVDVSSNHACALDREGAVHCWGLNSSNQLQLAAPFASSTPNPLSRSRRGRRLLAGDSHSCAHYESGHLACWGADPSGVNSIRPTGSYPVTFDPRVSTLTAGWLFSCVLRTAGDVMCWGDGGSTGALGRSDGVMKSPVPHAVAGLSDVVDVASGFKHSCAVRSEGSVWCWGSNFSGQLGHGLEVYAEPEPVRTSSIIDAVAVGAGTGSSCAVRRDGGVACWGTVAAGIDGAQGLALRPVDVSGVNDAIDVAVGSGFACALQRGGAVSCWGRNTHGALGDGTTQSRAEPRPAAAVDDAIAIAASGRHACALRASGEVWCWGGDAYGSLGRGRQILYPSPVEVP